MRTRDLTTINGFANAVADYLEEFGHYQGGTYYDELSTAENPPCCVRGAEARVLGWHASADRIDVIKAKPQGYNQALDAAIGDRLTVTWSDDTPTPEVVATLRGLH